MRNIISELGIIDWLLCLFLALSFSASGYYIETGDCELTFGLFLTAFVWLIVLVFITVVIRYYFAHTDYLPYSNKKSILAEAYYKFDQLMSKKNHIILIAVVIFICWLPVLIILYPGTCINDTWDELRQFIGFKAGTIQLVDHHPLFDTFLMGMMIVPIAELTGSWHIVMFGYVILQAACTCLAFSYTIDYAYNKLQIDNKFILIILVFYCLAPIYPASVQTISKDALFSWIFVFFFTYCIEIVRSGGEVLRNTKSLVVFIVLSVLCCLTKKVGFYVILITLICYLVFHKESRRMIIIPAICVFLVMSVFMPLIQDKLDVAPGGKQEMLSIPFQMTARYVKNCDDEIGEDEKIIIDKVLDYNDLADLYDPINADPVKQYSQKGEDSDYVAYIKVWVKQGFRHPGIYFSATGAMLSGWFSFYEYEPLMNMDWHGQLDTTMIPEWVTEREFSQKSADAYQEAFDNCYNNPLLRLFLTYGFYSALIPAFVIGTAFRRNNIKKCYWLAILPVVISLVLGCWLAPLSIHFEGARYLYPLTYSAPLSIMWCMWIYQSNKTEGEKTVKE